ncbi:hypothetical protein HFP57_16690 [Parasphingopyxis algicola]|nr:hypothetical protein HFP57_16690 [Parasphingopyxis algicola]
MPVWAGFQSDQVWQPGEPGEAVAVVAKNPVRREQDGSGGRVRRESRRHHGTGCILRSKQIVMSLLAIGTDLR